MENIVKLAFYDELEKISMDNSTKKGAIVGAAWGMRRGLKQISNQPKRGFFDNRSIGGIISESKPMVMATSIAAGATLGAGAGYTYGRAKNNTPPPIEPQRKPIQLSSK